MKRKGVTYAKKTMKSLTSKEHCLTLKEVSRIPERYPNNLEKVSTPVFLSVFCWNNMYRWVSLNTNTYRKTLGGQLCAYCHFLFCGTEKMSLNCVSFQLNISSILMINISLDSLTVLPFEVDLQVLNVSGD